MAQKYKKAGTLPCNAPAILTIIVIYYLITVTRLTLVPFSVTTLTM